VGTGVQQYDVARRCLVEVFADPVALCNDLGRVVLAVRFGLQTSVFGDGVVVAPGGRRHVHYGLVLVGPPSAHEFHAESECTRAGQSLDSHHAVFLQRVGGGTLSQLE